MTQKYVAYVTRTTTYRVVIDPDNLAGMADQVLATMEANSEDIEQYRVKGSDNGQGDPYGTDTAVMPSQFALVNLGHGIWAAALPSDSNETVDISANIVI